MDAARSYGEIVDIPFPNVNPHSSEDDVKKLGKQYCDEILRYQPEAVLCQGEFTLAVDVIRRLEAAGVRVVAACSERVVTEEDGVKKSIFRFVRFRAYS